MKIIQFQFDKDGALWALSEEGKLYKRTQTWQFDDTCSFHQKISISSSATCGCCYKQVFEEQTYEHQS